MFILKFMNDHSLISNENVVVEDKKLEASSSKETVENSNSENNLSSEDDEEYDFSKEFSDEDDSELVNNKYLVIEEEDLSDEDNGAKVLNIEDINKVRVNNTLALANKGLLKEETNHFEELKDYTFDQEIGYLVCSLLDSKLRCVSEESMIISFDYDSNVKQNLQLLDKLMEVYTKITKSDKKIAIVTDEEWEKLKNEYISNLKNGVKYEVQKEPEPILEEIKKDDIISNSAVELFGDIVEVE